MNRVNFNIYVKNEIDTWKELYSIENGLAFALKAIDASLKFETQRD